MTTTLIRNYVPEDKAELLDLFQICWGEEKRDMNQESWEWLYEHNPNTVPDRPVIFILEEEGKIIGSVSCVPARLMVKGKIFNFHWVMDYMVHPDKRGGMKGFRLAREVIKLSASTLGSGFPIRETVPIWLRAGRKVGVDEVGGFGPMVLPLNIRYVMQHKTLNPLVTGPLNLLFKPAIALQRVYRGLGAPSASGLRLREVEAFDERLTAFFERVGPGYPIIVVRDARYMNWRYTEYPGTTYRKVLAEAQDGSLRGYVVERMISPKSGLRQGLLVDFLVERGDEATLRFLIGHSIRRFRRERCDVVKGLEFQIPDMIRITKRLGFLPHPVKRNYLIFYNEICPDEPKSFFNDPANWYITRNFADQEINEAMAAPASIDTPAT